MELVANFELNNENNFGALFEINATPDISNLATKEELQETADNINNRIDNEVDILNDKIDTKIDTIEGSELIQAVRKDNTVTLTSQTFIFEQGIVSNEWLINHNLNKRPSIQLVDSSGREFEAVKDYISDNQIIIRLDSATTGYAYLN